jgi:predicted MFS family arabinose efflux permease
VDFDLFRVGSYRNGLFISTAYFAAAPALILLAALFLQQAVHLGAAVTGSLLVSFALGSSITAALSGRQVARWGTQFVAAGFILVITGTALWLVAMVAAPAELVPWLTIPTFLIGGLGAGLVTAPNQTVTLTGVPPDRAGVGGSLMQVGQRVGTAIGTSVALAVYGASQIGGDRVALVAGVGVCVLFFAAGLVVAVLDVARVRSASV